MGFLYPTEDNLSERRRSDFNQWSGFIAFFWSYGFHDKIWNSKMCIPRRIIFPSRQRRSIYYHISETDQYLDTNYFKRNLIENKKMAT